MKTHGTYNNGQAVSKQRGDTLTYYFKNGGVKARGNYIDGQFQGRWIFNKKEGHLWQVGHFHNNEKHGKWVRYKPDGSVEKDEEFSRGKRVKQ